jgi:hypothetical protein
MKNLLPLLALLSSASASAGASPEELIWSHQDRFALQIQGDSEGHAIASFNPLRSGLGAAITQRAGMVMATVYCSEGRPRSGPMSGSVSYKEVIVRVECHFNPGQPAPPVTPPSWACTDQWPATSVCH